MASTIYLGLSAIIFIIIYGVMFLIMPAILSTFFSAYEDNARELSPEWAAMYTDTTDTVRFFVPLIPTVGIFIFVLKVLLSSSSRGGD